MILIWQLRECGVRWMGIKINISDLFYALDIQNRNPKVSDILEKYGLDEKSFDTVKYALRNGKWNVC